jgi:hypothetical protein
MKKSSLVAPDAAELEDVTTEDVEVGVVVL